MPKGVFVRTEETKARMSAAQKEWSKTHASHRLGAKLSEESKKKMRKPHLSEQGRPKSEAHRKKIAEALKGKPKSETHRKNISGEGHWNWQGGKTNETKRIRNSMEYKIWRKAVYERDGYTCRFCGKKGGDLVADHIKPFSLFPELRFAIDNGRTLCDPCHKKTETFAVKAVYQKQKYARGTL